MARSKPASPTHAHPSSTCSIPYALTPTRTRSTITLRPPKPWHAHLTLDLALHVFGCSVFHFFICFFVPLCLRAQLTKREADEGEWREDDEGDKSEDRLGTRSHIYCEPGPAYPFIILLAILIVV
jgi:hypothetical protein